MNISNMLLIGAVEKNSGKTGLSVKIIRYFSKEHRIYAVKGTVLRDFEGRKGYSISEETRPDRQKDTGKLLAEGAEKVYWLKTDEEHAEDGIMEVLKKIPENTFILCESNTIRKYLKPGLFLMVQRENPVGTKKTATEVNTRAENIGARRLHTIMSTLLEDVLFKIPDPSITDIKISAEDVSKRLQDIVEDEDLSKYIL